MLPDEYEGLIASVLVCRLNGELIYLNGQKPMRPERFWLLLFSTMFQ